MCKGDQEWAQKISAAQLSIRKQFCKVLGFLACLICLFPARVGDPTGGEGLSLFLSSRNFPSLGWTPIPDIFSFIGLQRNCRSQLSIFFRLFLRFLSQAPNLGNLGFFFWKLHLFLNWLLEIGMKADPASPNSPRRSLVSQCFFNLYKSLFFEKICASSLESVIWQVQLAAICSSTDELIKCENGQCKAGR